MVDPVLIVDDDTTILTLLEKIIVSNNLQAETVTSGSETLDFLLRKNYSLMLLDINMPDMDGFEVIKRVRSMGNAIPIIIISGRKEDYDTIYGLEIGADDYIVKPFNPVTLGAKAKALIRRSSNNSPKRLTVGPFLYDLETLRFFKDGSEISLTSKESALMKLFLDNPNRIFPKSMLYELVWGDEFVNDNAVMVYINRLRGKIEDNPSSPMYLKTVRGVGYRLVIR